MLLAALVAPALAGGFQVIEEQAPVAASGVVKFSSRYEGVKVGVVRATDTDRAGNVTIIEKFYEEVCTAPCVVAMESGWYEFHFSYRKQEFLKKVEIRSGAQELVVRPLTSAGKVGRILTYTIYLSPISLPMWFAGSPKVKRQPMDMPNTLSVGEI